MSTFDVAAATALLESAFARWVQDLDLTVERVEGDSATLRMKFSDKLCRDNGVVCGQALMALADTAMVFAVSSAAGGYLPMVTTMNAAGILDLQARWLGVDHDELARDSGGEVRVRVGDPRVVLP